MKVVVKMRIHMMENRVKKKNM